MGRNGASLTRRDVLYTYVWLEAEQYTSEHADWRWQQVDPHLQESLW